MDTSETYIKMCEKAEEIHRHELEFGDWFGFPLADKLKGSGVVTCLDPPPKNVIWLPRQDQLQEMSGLDWRSFDKKCLVYEHPTRVPTKEQAGIRVVMKEHNKVWDGEWRDND